MHYSAVLLYFVSVLCILGNSGVVELTDDNFDNRLKGNRALVMFYSPTCGHCQRLKPTYEKLPKQPKIKQSGAIIAKVDCTDKGRSLCSRFSVNGYPTLKFISNLDGNEVVQEYEGNRELDDLVSFVSDNSLPSIQEIKDSEIDKFIVSESKPVILGLFKNENSKFYKKLVSLSAEKRNSFTFGYSFSSNVASKLELEQECVVFYRQQLLKSTLEPNTEVEKSEKNLKKFIDRNEHSLVEIRYPKNEDQFPPPLVVSFLPLDPVLQKSSFRRIRNSILRLAKNHTQTKFAISFVSSYAQFISEISPSHAGDEILLVAYNSQNKKFKSKDKMTVSKHQDFANSLSRFTEDFEKGDVLEEYIKSQKIPKENDGNVKVVVGKTFESIVLDDKKDVLIEFYAPWCGHCKKLEPLYQQLATMLKDEPNLVIAKMDATANDVHKDFTVQGFPTIYLAKAGQKSRPVTFDGKRTVDGFYQWLKTHTTYPIKYSGAVTEPKSDL